MAKIVKTTKKRSIKLQSFTVVFFLFAGICYLASSLFLRSYNNSLSTQKQTVESQIASIEVENDAIRVDIQNLSTRDRVVSIATDSGLTLNQENIVTITGD